MKILKIIVACMALACMVVPNIVWASTKYEYYYTATPDDAENLFGNVNRERGQSFTPVTTHIITTIYFYAFRAGTPGTLTIHVKLADVNGKPTGSDLCSGAINADTFTTDTAGAQYQVTLGAGALLTTGIKYTWYGDIVNTGNGTNRVAFRTEDHGGYATGNYILSDDGGSTWTVGADEDMLFEEWGNPSGWTHIASENGVAAASIATVNGQATTMAKINGVIP